MHWLDAERSREIDPVLDCLTFLARRVGPPVFAGPAPARGWRSPPTGTLRSTRSSRARTGRDARRAVAPALGHGRPRQVPGDPRAERGARRRPPRSRGTEGLVYAPGLAEPMWVKLDEIEPASPATRWSSKPIRPGSAQSERPWDKATATHWFWSEVWKIRREFWPVLLAALIVNLLAFAMPLFTMNVYDRVIPNKADSTLWVLALGVIMALVVRFILEDCPFATDRRDRSQARRKALAETVRKGDEPADGRAGRAAPAHSPSAFPNMNGPRFLRLHYGGARR